MDETLRQAREQREWIRAAREATNSRPVVLHKIPKWARHAIQKAYRDEGDSAGTYLDTKVTNDERWRGLFDHWGSSKIQRYNYSGPTFVTEPYACRGHIEKALRFADWIGCDVEIGGVSWWYPDNTTRIEFYPKTR